MYRVLLYYKFVPIDDPAAFALEHEALCRSLGLLGRILIAREGINGTVSGTVEACDAYMTSMWADPKLANLEFKVEEANEHAFKKLFIRVRDEIITLGMPLSSPVHQRTGAYLSPLEAKAMLDRDDVVFLDGRNQYESELGHFRGAICPPVGAFREIPKWIEEHRADLEDKQIVTYCTGGIRCEKLTAWMLEAGFEHVFQVRGGIVCYGQDPDVQGDGFEGVNVVFDDRVVTPVGSRSRPITACRECGAPSSNYVNCANVVCNARIILCEACEIETQRCCCEACRQAPTHREKNQKLQVSAPKTK
ncbi:MAG: hypothetical protein HONBIEJF_00833 [Fimbriimonadaceae bacterium]|nr:hypothetical protein [Fimbriimonadaceae bacterium]